MSSAGPRPELVERLLCGVRHAGQPPDDHVFLRADRFIDPEPNRTQEKVIAGRAD